MKYIVTENQGGYGVMEYNSYLNRYFPLLPRDNSQELIFTLCEDLRDRYMLIRVAELRKEYGRYRRIPGAEKRVF